MIAIHMTEISVAVKVWRIVVFYCIEPHCLGWYPLSPSVECSGIRISRLDRVRWPALVNGRRGYAHTAPVAAGDADRREG